MVLKGNQRQGQAGIAVEPLIQSVSNATVERIQNRIRQDWVLPKLEGRVETTGQFGILNQLGT